MVSMALVCFALVLGLAASADFGGLASATGSGSSKGAAKPDLVGKVNQKSFGDAFMGFIGKQNTYIAEMEAQRVMEEKPNEDDLEVDAGAEKDWNKFVEAEAEDEKVKPLTQEEEDAFAQGELEKKQKEEEK